MWDGNSTAGLVPGGFSFVEREPMWDGNRFSVLLVSSRSVEREPMWDGNAYAFLSVFAGFGLSENQCGMETPTGGTTRRILHR